MAINITLTPPSATDNNNFSIRGDTFLTDLVDFIDEANTEKANVDAQTLLAAAAVSNASNYLTNINNYITNISTIKNQISSKYLGVVSSLPATGTTGSFCLYNGTMKIWNGFSWQNFETNQASDYTQLILNNITGWTSQALTDFISISDNATLMQNRWMGILSSAPTGVQLVGSFYYDTQQNTIRVYDGYSYVALTATDTVPLTGGTISGDIDARTIYTDVFLGNTQPLTVSIDWYPPTELILGEIVSNTYVANTNQYYGGLYQGPSGFYHTLDFASYTLINCDSNGNGTLDCTVPAAGTEVTLLMRGAGGTYGQFIYPGSNMLFPGTASQAGDGRIQGPPLWNWKSFTFISDGTKLILTHDIGPMDDYTTPTSST